MEKQSRFEAFITEVDAVDFEQHFVKTEYPIFDALHEVHFSIWARTKEEVANKVAKIISLATNATIQYGPVPYRSSVIEWTFATDEFYCNFGIEEML